MPRRPSVSDLRNARRAVDNLVRAGMQDRYAQGQLANLLDATIRKIGGAFGRTLSQLIGPRTMSMSELRRTVQGMAQHVADAAVDPPPVIRGTPKPPPIPPGWADGPPGPPRKPPGTSLGGSSSDNDPPSRGSGRRRAPPGAPPLPGEEEVYGEVHRTPGSSNVWGFSWVPYADSGPGQRKGTLYVVFNAPLLHKSVQRAKGGRDHLALSGMPGQTVIGRTKNKGPTYAYDHIPITLYNEFKAAASAGTFVWDRLRVRGTIHGHQYPYRLVTGALIRSTGGGVFGMYVPRKATAKGYRSRASAALGTGRRAFTSNTIAPQKGFSTRRRRN